MKKPVSGITLLIIAGMIFFPVVASGEIDVRYTDDGFKIANDDQWIKIGGVLMWDVDTASGTFWDFEDDDDAWHTRSELRRARLNINTRMSKNWKAKLQFNYGDEDGTVEIKDAYVENNRWKMLNIIVGQDKEPFGLENLTSSKNLSFVERSMVSSAFAPGRNIGISLKGEIAVFNWQAGVYQAETREDDGGTCALSGRLAVMPWKTGNGFFHLGVSGSYRDYDGEKFEIKESAQIHTADNIIFSDEIDTDHLLLCGLETAFGVGPFSFAAEYMMTDVNAIAKEDDADLEGYYLSAGWFLTGEKRPFKNGTWGRVKPESPYGAFELIARYSSLDVSENKIGSTADACTAGVNWYINNTVCLMTDYMYLSLTDKETDEKIKGDAVSLRLQCIF